jgi:hypothetical protein
LRLSTIATVTQGTSFSDILYFPDIVAQNNMNNYREVNVTGTRREMLVSVAEDWFWQPVVRESNTVKQM